MHDLGVPSSPVGRYCGHSPGTVKTEAEVISPQTAVLRALLQMVREACAPASKRSVPCWGASRGQRSSLPGHPQEGLHMAAPRAATSLPGSGGFRLGGLHPFWAHCRHGTQNCQLPHSEPHAPRFGPS